MITREQVQDLQPGDVVELRMANHPDVVTRGPVRVVSNSGAYLGYLLLRYADGSPGYSDDCSLTVVSRAPRPLYVNHPRTEPVPGDVVRDADDVVWLRDSWKTWHSPDSTCTDEHADTGMEQPLRLLVDGETREVVQ